MMISRMRKERQKKSWTQGYVGSQVGVSKQAIQQIETLKSNPSYEILVKLETLFGLHRYELFKLVDSDESSS